jgi:hypothetical protein
MLVSKTEEKLDQDDVFFPGDEKKQISSTTRGQFGKSSKMLARRRLYSRHQLRKHQTEDNCIYNCQKELKMLSWSWILRPAPYGGNL